MSNYKTAQDLKVGDLVVIGHKRGPMTVETVTKVTATQITIKSGIKYSKNSGNPIGEGNDFSHSSWLQKDYQLDGGLMTIARKEEINNESRKEQEAKRLVRLISNNTTKLSGLSVTDLQTIAGLMRLE